MPFPKTPAQIDRRIEYKRLDSDRVLVIAYRPGKKPLKTIIEVFHPEQFEELREAPVPRAK